MCWLILVLFGKAYLPAVFTLRIGTLLTITLGFSDLFGTQTLVAFGEEKKRLKATIIGLATNVVLNLILIPIFAQNGAAVASVISEGVVTIIVYIYVRKHIKLQYRRKTVQALLISSAAMTGVLVCVKHLVESRLWELVLGVGLGAVVYLVVNFVMGNKGVARLMKATDNSGGKA